MIFDCDGVLVDSEPISARVGATVLADLGWAVTPDEVVRRFTGCTDEHWRSEIESELGRPLEDGWETPYESWYADAFEAELQAVHGVTEAIDDLAVPFCVASNGSHAKISANLGRWGSPTGSPVGCSAPRTCRAASRHRTSSCTPPRRWGFHRHGVSWWRTRRPVCRRPGRRACVPSPTAPGWSRGRR